MFGGNEATGRVAQRMGRIVAGVVTFGFVVTGCTQAPPPSTEHGDGATVVRVIDGDTIVADLSGTETTVRLLNIDTPETKHPDKPVECLGLEATEYTKTLLAPGDKIELAYDVSRLDPYGRTLAGVYKEGSLVNADIAAAGLGVAVLFQPNERFYAEVLAAEQQAQDGSKGLFGADVACTIPAMAEEAIAGLEALEEAVPTNADAVGSALGVVTAAIVAGKAKSAALQALDSTGDVVQGAVWAARKSTYAPLLAAALTRATSIEEDLTTKQSALAQAKQEADARKQAEAKAAAEKQAKAEAAAKAKAKAERKAVAARLEAARKKAAEKKAVESRRQSTPKPTYRPPVQKAKPRPKPKAKSKPRGGGSKSGYTGPRCYAPGGKSWKPC